MWQSHVMIFAKLQLKICVWNWLFIYTILWSIHYIVKYTLHCEVYITLWSIHYIVKYTLYCEVCTILWSMHYVVKISWTNSACHLNYAIKFSKWHKWQEPMFYIQPVMSTGILRNLSLGQTNSQTLMPYISWNVLRFKHMNLNDLNLMIDDINIKWC